MATRAYVQPKTILGNIQYLNPNVEVISADKNLIPLDSSLQCLNPGNNTYKVILPEEIYCDGMIFNIINSSALNGILEIYDFNQTNKLFDLRPGVSRQFICLGQVWQSYNTFDSSYQSLPFETENYSFTPSMTPADINNVIQNIQRYVHINKTINFYFDGDFINYGIQLNGFYGGGLINILPTTPTCRPKITSATIYPIYLSDNKNISFTIEKFNIESESTNIHFVGNINSVLHVRDSRLINTIPNTHGNGIYCEKNLSSHNNINIINTSFGNLENCVYVSGDYHVMMDDCKKALTESSNPQPMPSDYAYYLDNGGTIVMAGTTSAELGIGQNQGGNVFS